MLLKHTSPEHNATQRTITGNIHIDWNGPVASRADHLLSASLDSWFGSKGWLAFQDWRKQVLHFWMMWWIERSLELAFQSYMPPSETKKVNWFLFLMEQEETYNYWLSQKYNLRTFFAQHFYLRYFHLESLIHQNLLPGKFLLFLPLTKECQVWEGNLRWF